MVSFDRVQNSLLLGLQKIRSQIWRIVMVHYLSQGLWNLAEKSASFELKSLISSRSTVIQRVGHTVTVILAVGKKFLNWFPMIVSSVYRPRKTALAIVRSKDDRNLLETMCELRLICLKGEIQKLEYIGEASDYGINRGEFFSSPSMPRAD